MHRDDIAYYFKGAGDAFVGALAGYLATNPPDVLEREEPGTAAAVTLGGLLRRAAAVASHSVRAKGTQASYIVETLAKDLLIARHSDTSKTLVMNPN